VLQPLLIPLCTAALLADVRVSLNPVLPLVTLTLLGNAAWPDGRLVKWQDSHAVAYGMWLFAPFVLLLAGIATIAGIPAKDDPLMPAPWQLAQPVEIPVWLYLELANDIVLLIAVAVARLLPVPTWQVSQAVEPANGTCVAGGALIVKLTDGMA